MLDIKFYSLYIFSPILVKSSKKQFPTLYNLKALDDLKKQGIEADLIYLDPAFFSHRHYEVVWGDEAEVRSFKDRWAGGINVYIEWMRERVVKMYDVLKDTGSFYIHYDWHASHYLKVMLDDIFGYKKFRNEIVWCYKLGGRPSKGFPKKHDVILFYTKSDDINFYSDAVRVPYEGRGRYSSSGLYGAWTLGSFMHGKEQQRPKGR